MEATTASSASERRHQLGWLTCIALVGVGVAVCLIASATLAALAPPRLWLSVRDTLGLPAQLASIGYMAWNALGEEIAKALGAVSARLRTNKLSWWLVAALIGFSFGIFERALLMLSWTPEFLAQVTPAMRVALNIAAVLSHAALCVLSAAIALSLGGRWRGWAVGVFAAGALHAVHNLAPRLVELDWPFARTAVSAAIMLVILIITFALRERIALRATSASA